MKVFFYILFISPLLWSYSCKQEPCIPTKYKFTEQDLEWQIYQIGQQYKYKNLTTGEIRIYTVTKIEKTVIESNDGWSSKRDKCPRNPREAEALKVQLLTDKLEQLNITFEVLSISVTPKTDRSSASMFISFQDFGLTRGSPNGYIDAYESSFVDGQPIHLLQLHPFIKLIFVIHKLITMFIL
ncbi:MAG: hypothetical protein MUC49_19015 [Raineya sp.]|jgi:hypothetical protein|nr:hypothetical protein [Raineya sp.]